MKRNMINDTTNKIVDHLTYNQICYNYVDFLKHHSEEFTIKSMERLFGDSWRKHSISIREMCDQINHEQFLATSLSDMVEFLNVTVEELSTVPTLDIVEMYQEKNESYIES